MGEKVRGNLVIIGGAEDKEGECRILRRFVELAGGDKARLVIMTTATEQPHVVGSQYERIFTRIGVKRVDVLDIASREAANQPEPEEVISQATGVFFTGGDQLRITTLLGGTLVDKALHQAYQSGVVIAGTSAGASVMSDTMIIDGSGDDTPKKNTVNMAPGMGLIEEVVIDQHFAQRGRIGRLLSAVAQNPYMLGIGIDEDTAVIVTPEGYFEVCGSQTVTVIDGRQVKHTNISELEQNQPLAITGVVLHILPPGYQYDLKTRQPFPGKVGTIG